jgi:Cdc6-like AAA superfamily ATPase
MIKNLVPISNFSALMIGHKTLDTRGATEASFMLVTSAPGIGKTAALKWLASQKKKRHYVYLRAKVTWSVWWFLTDLLEACGMPPDYRNGNMFRKILAHLKSRPETVLIIDECEHALENKKVIETVRGLSDEADVSVILAGMDKAQHSIEAYPQLSSRLAAVVNFQPATIEDAKNIAMTLLEGVTIGDCLIAEVHRQCKGQMRILLNILARCEAEAKDKGISTLTLEDMAGKQLTHDWRAERPVLASKAKLISARVI